MDENDPWYKEGLRFNCTQCGKCCTGSPGFVWITEEEMQSMATFLNISLEMFIKQYTRQVGKRFSLLEHHKNYDCVFLKNNRCCVYGARPKQCRNFPWWKENLESPASWEETSLRCEGINSQDAPLISCADIQKLLD